MGASASAVGDGPGVRAAERRRRARLESIDSPPKTLHSPAPVDSLALIVPAGEGPQAGPLLLPDLWETDLQGTLPGASLVPSRDVVRVLDPSWTELPCLLVLCPKTR